MKQKLIVCGVAAGWVFTLLFTNTYLSDPLALRKLPDAIHFILLGVFGLITGAIFYGLIVNVLQTQRRKIERCLLLLVALAGAVYLSAQINRPALALTRFTIARVTLTALPEHNPAASGNAVVLREFSDPQNESIPFHTLNPSTAWETTPKGLAASQERPAVLQYSLLGGKERNVRLLFATGADAGMVAVNVDGSERRLDLYEPAPGETALTLPLGQWSASGVSNTIHWVNAASFWGLLFLLLSTLHWEKVLQDLKRQAQSLTWRQIGDAAMNWFEETAPRLQTINLLVMIYALFSTVMILASAQLPAGPAPVTPPAASSQSPNVILIAVDTLTAEDMSLYGYPLRTTPNLEKLAETWSVYDRAYSTGNMSITFFPTVMSGRYPYFNEFYQYGDLGRGAQGWLNLASILKNMGYETIWHGDLTPGYYHMGYAFDRSICRTGITGFIDRTYYQMRAMPHLIPPFFPFTLRALELMTIKDREEQRNCDGLAAAQDLFRSRKPGDPPFFLFLHYLGLHTPYRPDVWNYVGTFLPREAGYTDEASLGQLRRGRYAPEEQPEIDKFRLRYDEAILNEDRRLNETIELLRTAGLYDNALIIITSDHGSMFTHGYTDYGTPLLAIPETHVPLLIKFPNQQEGRRINNLVSSVDLFPTILDTLGVQYPREWIDGRSLVDLTANDPERFIYLRRSNSTRAPNITLAVMDDRYKFVRRLGDEDLYLFDHQADHNEEDDLYQAHIVEPQRADLLHTALDRYSERMRLIRLGTNIFEAPPLINP